MIFFYDKKLRPGQDSNLRSPKEETVFETVALPLDYLGILLNQKKNSCLSDFPYAGLIE